MFNQNIKNYIMVIEVGQDADLADSIYQHLEADEMAYCVTSLYHQYSQIRFVRTEDFESFVDEVHRFGGRVQAYDPKDGCRHDVIPETAVC